MSLQQLKKTARKSSENIERLGTSFLHLFSDAVTCIMLMRLRLICIMKLTTSESPREFLFTYKRRFIFGFSSKYRVKNKHEFVDSSHQNKQNFEGKKLSGLSGKEFIAFEECVWQIRHRFSWSVFRHCLIFPQPPCASAHIPRFLNVYHARSADF